MKKVKCELHGIYNPILIVILDKSVNIENFSILENKEQIDFYVEKYKKKNKVIARLKKGYSNITILLDNERIKL